MVQLNELTGGRGFVRCRYCRFARPPGRGSGAPWTCTSGDNPGPLLDADICECEYGELVTESEANERKTI